MTPREKLIVGESGISQDEAKRVLSEQRLEKLPLVDSDGRLAGLITAKDLAGEEGWSRPTRDSKGRLAVAAAVGVGSDYLERAETLVQAGVDALVIDIAHGDSILMLSTINALRECLGSFPLVAGNVATTEATERLIEAGADAVKVGVGPGSVCVTRQVAGAGMPQLTAVLECSKVARKRGVPIIADGGIRSSGDVAKAIGAGASSVMIGNLLAGTEESPGVTIQRNGRKMKVARGLASQEAVKDRAFREDPERGWTAWENADANVAPEGVQGAVPFRGMVREVLSELLAGLRSGMSYCNASTIEEMWRNTGFVRQTPSGIHEGRTHDVFEF